MSLAFLPGSTGFISGDAGTSPLTADLPVSNRLSIAGATAISAFLEVPKGLVLTTPSGGELIYRIWTGPNYDDVGSWVSTGVAVDGGSGPFQVKANVSLGSLPGSAYAIQLGVNVQVNPGEIVRVDVTQAMLITE